MQRCLRNDGVDVVDGHVALHGGGAFQVFHDGVLHVECGGEPGKGRAIASLDLCKFHVVLGRQAVQHCVEKVVKGLHLFQLLALSTGSVGRFKFFGSCQDAGQLLHVQGSEKW